MRARFPGLGSREADFEIFTNFLMRRPGRSSVFFGESMLVPPVPINPILLESGGLLLLENGNYLQKE